MKRKKITNTDLACSAIALGGVDIGNKLTEQEAFRLMDMYVESGGNMIRLTRRSADFEAFTQVRCGGA